MLDSRKEMFFVPGDKVEKLDSLIKGCLSADYIECKVLEKCVSKCRSMDITMQCAILHMRAH